MCGSVIQCRFGSGSRFGKKLLGWLSDRGLQNHETKLSFIGLLCSSALFGTSLLSNQALAYNFPDGTNAETTTSVGDCVFTAKSQLDDLYDDGQGWGQIEVQYRKGRDYKYVGPRLDFDLNSSSWTVTPFTSLQMTEAGIENDCGIDITDGTFSLVNEFVGPTQSYASTTKQSVSFDTATNSYFFEITGAADITPPAVTITSPEGNVTDVFSVTFEFSEAVTGFTTEDVLVTNGTKGAFTSSGTSYTLVIDPELGKAVSVAVGANVAFDASGNRTTVAQSSEIQAGSPASEFASATPEIKKIILEDAQNALRNTMAANTRLMHEAKSRLIDARRDSKDKSATEAQSPIDIDAQAKGSDDSISAKGSLSNQLPIANSNGQQLFFADASVISEDGGSKTMSLNTKIAWEWNLSDQTLYGYFIDVALHKTDVKTRFAGDQKSYGLNLGAYAATAVHENVYLDGFVSAGLRKTQLDISNGTLRVDGDYRARSFTVGGSMTGTYEWGDSEFWPELSASLGRTIIGEADFTGHAFGLVDDTLRLDAGKLTMAKVTLRPEVRVNLQKDEQTQGLIQVSYAPRLLCERITTDSTSTQCGRGAEIGFVTRSANGRLKFTSRFIMDRVDSSTRRGLSLTLENRF